MKKMPLTQGKFALVDDADYEWLSRWKWHAHEDHGNWYAERWRVRMHNEILPPPAGLEVDHKNHDGLDNRRINLRLGTHAQNGANRLPNKNHSSIFKGVTRRGGRGKWQAAIRVNGQRTHLGQFGDEQQAARAYDAAALAAFGEFARTNF